MITNLGKSLRIIRINAGDSMRDMAKKLDLSVSYLSAIENGKRNVPSNFEEKVLAKYNLNKEETKEFKNAVDSSINKIKVDVDHLSEDKKKILLALKNNTLDDSAISKMCEIIDMEQKDER